jgi:Enoyl-(Acyl carrier protein) reductase
VVGEALTNVARHAQASEVFAQIQAQDGGILASVCDDGVGGADPSRGSGLIGLRDRTDALGATMIVVSPPAIAPGYFAIEMTDQYPPGYVDSVLARVPAGRRGDPGEPAATVVFLASDAAGYITGQTLVVDGGMTIA